MRSASTYSPYKDRAGNHVTRREFLHFGTNICLAAAATKAAVCVCHEEDQTVPEAPQIEISFATANLPPAVYASMGTEGLHELLSTMSCYDDAEITPSRAFMLSLGWQAAKRCFSNERDGQRLVGSIHQTFAQPFQEALERSWRTKDVLPLAVWSAMNPMADSLQDLREIRTITRQPLPAVLYGHYKEVPVFNTENSGLGPRLIQLYPEQYQHWGIGTNSSGLASVLGRAGFTGICLDVFHLRRGSQDTPGFKIDPGKAMSAISAGDIPIPELHFAIGRTDSVPSWDQYMHRTTMQELTASLKSSEAIGKTLAGEMLLEAKEIHRRQQTAGTVGRAALRIVVEVGAQTLPSHKGMADFIRYHQAIAANVREFVKKR